MWAPERPFPVDMAGYGLTVASLLESKARYQHKVNGKWTKGWIESYFLMQVFGLDENLVRSKEIVEKFGVIDPIVSEKTMLLAKNCTEVLVWHTKTEQPEMKYEPQAKHKWPIGVDVEI